MAMLIQMLFIQSREEYALSVEQVEMAARGQLKVVFVADRSGLHISRIVPLRLSAKEQAVFEASKRCGYLSSKKFHGRLSYVWRRYCQAVRQPFVYVIHETGVALATVGVDMSTTHGLVLTDEAMRIISRCFSNYRRKEGQPPGYVAYIGPISCEDKYIAGSEANELAQKLCSVAGKKVSWVCPYEY